MKTSQLEKEMMGVIIDLIGTYIFSDEYLQSIISICENRAKRRYLEDDDDD